MLLAPPLATFALRFGPPEYFALLVLGLVMVGYLSGGSMTKGLTMAALGLLLGTVGLDPIMGSPRFTYGIFQLGDGLPFILAAMGLFGIGEVLVNVERSDPGRGGARPGSGASCPSRTSGAEPARPSLRGSLLGFLVGVLPGGGAVISSFLSYSVEKRWSREPERFGQGAIEGVAGPESANNAAATGSFIPLLTLGVPGNASIAMIFAALLIHGVRPGPLLVTEHPDVFWGLLASMYIGNVVLLALNLPLIWLWIRLLRVPYPILAPFILVFVLVGAYSVNNSVFDLGLTVAFGRARLPDAAARLRAGAAGAGHDPGPTARGRAEAVADPLARRPDRLLPAADLGRPPRIGARAARLGRPRHVLGRRLGEMARPAPG